MSSFTGRWKAIAALAALTVFAAAAAPAPAPVDVPDYPPTRQVDQVDDYFGTAVRDPYRWLEDDNAADTKAWVAAQNRVTDAYLARIPFRDAVRARVRALSDYPKDSRPFQHHGRIYFFRNDGLRNQAVLCVQQGVDGKPETLLDPNGFSADGTVRLTSFTPSRDGRYAVYGRTSIPGSDWEEFRVMDLATKTTLPEVLRWSKFTTPAWRGGGFYYSRLPEPAKGAELTAGLLGQSVWFHRIGTPQSADTLVFEDPAHPSWTVELTTTRDERIETLYQQDLSRRGPVVSVRDRGRDETRFRPVVAEPGDARFEVVDHDGGALLVRIDPNRPAPGRWRTVLPERTEALESVVTGGGRLFAHYLKDVASRIEVFRFDGRRTGEIALPGPGTAGVAGGDADSREVFFSFTSLEQPPTVWRYDIASGRQTLFREPKVAGFDPSRFESHQLFFPSKDGTRIPMFVVHRKGLVLDGSAPTILTGYGGFDITINPGFDAGRIAWLEQGGVFALVNLRGGGEYGEAWHEAGMRANKQNVFDDCIAAAETLVREKYTSPARLALQGGSNGGLLVGAVVNQRPDLFRVALPQVGVMDMLRFQKLSVGAAWVSEYGSSDDADQFRTLRAYSPLHNIRAGGRYPATLVSTADHDDRVVPAHSFKYIATLQAEAGRDSGPLLIRIATRSGHGASNLGKRLEEQADGYSFAWFNMGVVPTDDAGRACPDRCPGDAAPAAADPKP